MRLRIFDLNTPWFWLTLFWQRSYGKPFIELSIWRPNSWKKWWLNVWKWEERRTETGGYALVTTKTPQSSSSTGRG